ncbi:uncharacterized protein DNG_07329 [Cephalotrichum gorgonifer]|uniref:Uncharacterized protein n=1 Tax=Cephalotrichum gorgonifer TaxID=2041049 RepID=A0AAE8N377_9PEZI|nr:uncharacterized protein DNG_07329 [Cephalotrichum gorgonifer]
MNEPFRRGPTIGQIWVHALALVSGFTALIGLIGTSILPSLPWRPLVVTGLAAAVGVLAMNTYDIISLVKSLRTETDRRWRPMWRIAINLFAVILTVAGALTVPVPASDQGFVWAATAAICLLIAGGFHGVLFVWAIVDSVRGRRRRRRNGQGIPLEPRGKEDPR